MAAKLIIIRFITDAMSEKNVEKYQCLRMNYLQERSFLTVRLSGYGC